MQYSAIILAAGYGSRIKGLTEDPKSLLIINDKSLMEWHIRHLESINFKKIIVVVGYRGNKIVNLIKSLKSEIPIEFVRNKDYKKKGNAYSMYMGLMKTDAADNVIIIDADLVYSNEVIINFVKDNNLDSILVGEGTLDDIECAKTIVDSHGYVRKTIDKRLVNNEELNKYIFAGEAIGMIKISKENRGNIISVCDTFLMIQVT